jgi:hypothetical protein
LPQAIVKHRGYELVGTLVEVGIARFPLPALTRSAFEDAVEF